MKTTPQTSGASELACRIANDIGKLDGLRPHVDAGLLAHMARVIDRDLWLCRRQDYQEKQKSVKFDRFH